MTYVIVTEKQTVIGQPFADYDDALDSAIDRFGEDAADWIDINLRIEENR